MALPPEQLKTAHEYFRILEGVARRLILEGKARLENGKLLFNDDVEAKTQ